MTTVKTASQRGASNRRRGHTAERNVANFLRSVGYPDAERAVVTGFASASGGRLKADPGDITGVPFIVSVKDCATEQIDKWLDELDAMQHLTGLVDPPRLLVHKRRGKASPERWWCWMRAWQFLEHGGPVNGRGLMWPVRMEFAAALVLLADSARDVEAS